MMQRLAAAPKSTRTFLDRQRRWLNKKLGRPATQDVGTLSEMILSLKTATEEEIKRPMDRVVVAVPLLLALTDEDIDDALEYSRLRPIMVDGVTSRLGEADALFAANGKGLCKNHKNNFACQDEAESRPLHQVFTVSCQPEWSCTRPLHHMSKPSTTMKMSISLTLTADYIPSQKLPEILGHMCDSRSKRCRDESEKAESLAGHGVPSRWFRSTGTAPGI